MDILADTGFLIDLWREQDRPGPASHFASTHSDYAVGICWIVAGEFLCGSVLAGQDRDETASFIDRYPVAHSDTGTVLQYADLYAVLRKRNAMIGPNDLWIAACALAHGLPVVTRNVEEFRRVPNLSVIDYRKPSPPAPGK
ncbi:MAG: type II toxin-antitoxin system VapC family toxin [bacterium]